MSRAIKLKNNYYLDSSSIMYERYNRQDLKTKIQLFSTKSLYNTKTGETGWGKIAHIPSSGGYFSKEIILLLSPGMGDTGTGYGIVHLSYYDNSKVVCKIITGNIPVNNIIAVKNSDDTIDIWFYLEHLYTPLRVQLLSIYNSEYEPWDVFKDFGWKQSNKPTGGIQYNFSYI